MVTVVLELVGKGIEQGGVSDEVRGKASRTLKRWESNATILRDTFEKALPSKETSKYERREKALPQLARAAKSLSPWRCC